MKNHHESMFFFTYFKKKMSQILVLDLAGVEQSSEIKDRDSTETSQ